MLKFFHVARISNFYIFLIYMSHILKYIVPFRLDALLGLQYMVGKI